MNVAAAWYPDPSGRWELRWWDGNSWTEQVATGSYQSSEPVSLPPMPAEPSDQPVFLFSGVSERQPVRLELAWTTLGFIPERRVHETRRWPLSFIARVIVDRESADGSGTLRLLIRGTGYVGPSTVIVANVAQVHGARALILRQRAIVTGWHATAS